jgi:hypothetical protein
MWAPKQLARFRAISFLSPPRPNDRGRHSTSVGVKTPMVFVGLSSDRRAWVLVTFRVLEGRCSRYATSRRGLEED